MRLSCYSPGIRCPQPRSPARWSKCPLARGMAPPEEFPPASCTPSPAPLPRTREGGAAPPGGRRRASRRLYSVRTPRGWLGPARGEFLAPNSPLGPPPVLLAGFWTAGRARNPLDFVRWVVPIKARGRYTLCSDIHRAEGARRAWNSHFKLLAQVAIASGVRTCLSRRPQCSSHKYTAGIRQSAYIESCLD